LGDRILVWKQSNPIYNGIYVVQIVGTGSNGVWVRSTDTNGSGSGTIYGGDYVFVINGVVLAGHGFVVVGDGQRIIGVNNINWRDFTAGGTSRAGGLLTALQKLHPTSNSNLSDYNTGLQIPNDLIVGSHIIITVNGNIENISYGDKTGSFYISADNGVTVKIKANIAANDYLWFSPANAGYKLEITDEINLIYSA
jgi:hypothetical protein